MKEDTVDFLTGHTGFQWLGCTIWSVSYNDNTINISPREKCYLIVLIGTCLVSLFLKFEYCVIAPVLHIH